MGSVGGDDRPGEVNGAEQGLDLGGRSRVLIRFSLGTGTLRRSGHEIPPSAASMSWGRSAAWSPISRKLLAPGGTQTTATASVNASENRAEH